MTLHEDDTINASQPAAPASPAHPAPPRPPRARHRIRYKAIALVAIVTAFATTIVGLKYATLIPDAVHRANGGASAHAEPLPRWCTDVAQVRAERARFALVDGVELPRPTGIQWWLADQFASLLGGATRARVLDEVVKANTLRRSSCPLGEDVPALFPDEACAEGGHMSACHRWVQAVLSSVALPPLKTVERGDKSVEPETPNVTWHVATRQRALESATVMARVIEGDLAALREFAASNRWWRVPGATRTVYLEAFIKRTKALLASLAPQARRQVVNPRLDRIARREAPIAAVELAVAYRLAVADDKDDPDCETLLALSLATETDFKTPARIGLGTVHLDRRPTRSAGMAARAAAANHCTAVLDEETHERSCRHIEKLEALAPEIAPLMAARNASDCDLEEVLGLTKGGLGARSAAERARARRQSAEWSR